MYWLVGKEVQNCCSHFKVSLSSLFLLTLSTYRWLLWLIRLGKKYIKCIFIYMERQIGNDVKGLCKNSRYDLFGFPPRRVYSKFRPQISKLSSFNPKFFYIRINFISFWYIFLIHIDTTSNDEPIKNTKIRNILVIN